MLTLCEAVGKTSLVLRYTRQIYDPTTHSTVGASFLTKRVVDVESGTTVRLQIWDTAGQERFRSMSRLYYRGANAGILCYDVTDVNSFEEMTKWLVELKENLTDDAILHVVGTKADLVQQDPALRRVPFERVTAFVEEHLGSSPPASSSGGRSSPAKKPNGQWGQDMAGDFCHEVSAKDGEGIEEVFRVIIRKLIEQRNERAEKQAIAAAFDAKRPAATGKGRNVDQGGSFRIGKDRRSWIGFPPSLSTESSASGEEVFGAAQHRRPRCC